MPLSLDFIFAYLLGGITFIPLLLIFSFSIYLVHKHLIILPIVDKHTPKEQNAALTAATATSASSSTNTSYRVGWLRVSSDPDQSLKDASIGDIVKNYISGKTAKREHANVYFAVLKYTTLYLYDSERQLDCKRVINLSNHTVEMHPPGLQDYELFSKPHLIQLKGQESNYYVNCHKCIDKEDWYFALLRASKSTLPRGEYKHDNTHFDQSSMNHLITMVHSDEHHFQTQWLNAILGRIFFGVYRTQEIKDALYNKIITKLDKINAKRPPFLGEITVRSVDPGHALPRFTQPKLLGLSPTGELTAEAVMQYDGGFRIEIETVLKWKYSDLMRPLTVDLVLGITLKEIEGKLLIKFKEPPTNRFWYGFYECPKMEWKVEPVVWEKRVGYSVVVKAIETKIQEFIAETMVLPHFDDILFFPTDGLGGIFEAPPQKEQEQKREQKQEEVEEEEEEKVTLDDAASAPGVIQPSSVSPVVQVDQKKARKDRHKADEALLTTAKSLPELFSAVPDRQTSKLRTALQGDTDLSSSLLAPTAVATAEPSVTGGIAIPNTHHESPPSYYLSTSPDDASLLSSSPHSLTEDSFRTISHVITTDSSNLIVSPSTSSSLTCDSSLSKVQITYSQDSATSSDMSTASSNNNSGQNQDKKIRKSSSLALLRPKTGASTAVNISPAMAHKQEKKEDLDTISVAVASM